MKHTDLSGKVVVITGASSGAGRAAAVEFAQSGAILVLASRNEDALTDVADECRQFTSEIMVVPTDVTDTGAMINLANSACAEYGRVDVWVNNAGVLAAGQFDDTPMAVHKQAIETNLVGYMNGAHAILPIFKEQGHGVIINNISIGGFFPVPYGAGYSASKFGLRGFSEALRGELSEWPGIHVCNLYPAFLDTPGIVHAGNHTGKVLKPAPPVYDPARLARAMVKVAAHPRATTYVGSASLLLQFSHALFPKLSTRLTAAFINAYLKKADPIALTDGNLFTSVNYAMSPYGGYGLPGKPKAHRKYVVGALAAVAALGLYWVARNKDRRVLS